jgi:hypothetical protein
MKKFQFIYALAIVMVVAVGCTKDEGIDDDLSFLNSVSSSNVTNLFTISNDNSGMVKITPNGQGVTSYVVKFGDATGGVDFQTITPGESATHAYPEGNYTVSITAYDIAGKATTTTYPLTLTYRAPENVLVKVESDVRVSATADFAKSFLVYYGDVANETGTPLAVGQVLPAHIYAAGGPYDLKVVALSGGVAKTTVVKTMFGFPLTFESPTMNYFFGTFGNVVFSKVANPLAAGINTSAMVGKYEKPNGAPSWSGTYSPMDIPINMAHDKKVKIMVYNPSVANIGKKLNVELEAQISGTGATANGVAVLKAPITTSGAWEELTFDFSTIAAIGANARYGQLVFRFNDNAEGSGEVIYIDNIRLTN